VIGGLLPPSAGRVVLDGRDLATLDADALARVRNAEIGFVFQDHHLLPQCTVLENVLVPTLAEPRGTDRHAATARARELLGRVGLEDRLTHLPARLSGGERQRVALVRALIMRPQLLLADEPTGALDAHTSQELIELLCTLNADEGVALLVVTHSAPLARRMGRIVALRDGRLHQDGTGP
jgi:predicted ABC-type transport system involved in lysophospholipase L1 biosynthesis ATPase subunit